MAIDTLPDVPTAPPAAALRRPDPPYIAANPWWKRGLLAVVGLGALAGVAALIATAMPSTETGPKLTHVITRGDLPVSVLESGTLESSENTEIKCKVRGDNTVIWVIDSGTMVQPGDELLRLDSLFIEEQINERTKYAHWSRSAAEQSAANLVRAELAVDEYEKGRFVAELMTLQKDLTVAQARLKSAQSILDYTRQLAASGYAGELDVEENEFAVSQAELEVALKQTEIDVLQRFTKEETLQTLRGDLAAVTATHKANAERATADASRRDRALEEYQYCVVKAERAGMVIHPSVAKWETAPIAEGSTVYKDQVLLLMPDLNKMQVKVGVKEAVVDRVKSGMKARVKLPDRELEGTVTSVASVTRPAGWWSGNEVRYDTLIALPPVPGLTPGMSAEVEIIIATHPNVVSIPVAAIVTAEDGNYCWVKTPSGMERRALTLGDSNEVFTIVKEGLQEGDEVALNPLAYEPLGGASKDAGTSEELGDETPSIEGEGAES